MARTIHMCISVRGMLNWNRVDAKRNMKSITKRDGTHYASFEELKHELYDELAKGHEVLPLGEACEGFDYKKGCPGHEQDS
jgi:hypothetical protein